MLFEDLSGKKGARIGSWQGRPIYRSMENRISQYNVIKVLPIKNVGRGLGILNFDRFPESHA